MIQAIQKIIFGSPGTGKSYRVKNEIIPNDLKINSPANIIHAVFHPEYTYGDFMGKLLPLTRDGSVEYNFYAGHFLKALARSYKNLLSVYDKNGEKTAEPENVVLVIDEINRGNSSAIFGSIFQLLDREENGWSSYETTINGVMFIKLLELLGVEYDYDGKGEIKKITIKNTDFSGRNYKELNEKINFIDIDFVNQTIKIPPNLSIIATMNTSDSSIYYMDSAFKRRWEWEFINIDSKPIIANGNAFTSRKDWEVFIKKLNEFIKDNHQAIRGIEDKQVGTYFIQSDVIEKSTIQGKLMFFLWDSVFNRDKKPLADLLNIEKRELITFGDFAQRVDSFIKAINDR